MSDELKGSCFCGAVEVAVTGDPAAMGYCHCESCRHWSAGPVNAFSLWPPSAVTVTKGASSLGQYSKNPTSVRKFCTTCGGHVFTDHPLWNVVDVYAAVLPSLRFVPKMHVSYGEKVVAIRDGLPKFKDMPADMGGSGETLPE